MLCTMPSSWAKIEFALSDANYFLDIGQLNEDQLDAFVCLVVPDMSCD
jgi:hypothetical protein